MTFDNKQQERIMKANKGKEEKKTDTYFRKKCQT